MFKDMPMNTKKCFDSYCMMFVINLNDTLFVKVRRL